MIYVYALAKTYKSSKDCPPPNVSVSPSHDDFLDAMTLHLMPNFNSVKEFGDWDKIKNPDETYEGVLSKIYGEITFKDYVKRLKELCKKIQKSTISC